MPPQHLLPTIFSSLTRTPPSTPIRWTLLRTLKSDNPHDIQGDLHGTATFTPLHSTTPSIDPNPNTEEKQQAETHTDLLYSEEGSLPQSFGPGLRWTKKYIWRLSSEGRISVWFVKVDKKNGNGNGNGAEEADYLFHEFDSAETASTSESRASEGAEFVTPPVPPEVDVGSDCKTEIVAARGNHLCVADMYRTAYAFRVAEGSGEVLSWASRHVVRGPRKGQDIVNLYSRDL
ncbi:hypothetical protein BDW62DRAFT_203064 [Aspergillus aurantiobrunneus]